LYADDVAQRLAGVSGILVAPGFGGRGIEGKLVAVQYARERGVPFFGICLGMQCAVIEFARNVCGWEGANSTEFDAKTEFPIIDFMQDQRNIENMGGTMRLGKYACRLEEGSLASQAYGDLDIMER
ncbi:CTP synthase, partial [Arthrospira platensis SPKY1]|nr:CTP synthase [Arthrospira platensis SPKY1]